MALPHINARDMAVLYLSDDDPMLRGVQQMHFLQAIAHLDHAHVFRDLWSAAPDAARAQRWIGQLCRGQPELAFRSLPRHIERSTAHEKHGRKVLELVEREQDAFYGWRHYRQRHDPERTQRLPAPRAGSRRIRKCLPAAS